MPHILENNKVEYGSALRIVRNLGLPGDRFQVHDTVDNFMGARGIPKSGVIDNATPFETELRGSGGGGGVSKTPPDATCFKAAGLKETVSTTVSTTYAWTGAFPTDVTAADYGFFYGNAFKKVCTSAVADLTMTLITGAPCICSWNVLGLYAASSETASAASLETTAFAPVCKALTLSIGGVASGIVIRRLIIALNNRLQNNPGLTGTAGMHAPYIAGSRVTFIADIQTPASATWNSETRLTAGTKCAWSIVLGATAGNIFTITADTYPLSLGRIDMEGSLGDTLGFAQSEVATADTKFNIVCT